MCWSAAATTVTEAGDGLTGGGNAQDGAIRYGNFTITSSKHGPFGILSLCCKLLSNNSFLEVFAEADDRGVGCIVLSPCPFNSEATGSRPLNLALRIPLLPIHDLHVVVLGIPI